MIVVQWGRRLERLVYKNTPYDKQQGACAIRLFANNA